MGIIAGFEAGLTMAQTLRGVMVVNKRPCLWGDAALAVVRSSPKCASIREWMEGEGDAMVAYCEGQRTGEKHPILRSFSVADAKRAGLWAKSGPWTQYPKRMLAMRARAFTLRDGWPDVLAGMGVAEEEVDAQAEDTGPTFAQKVDAARARESAASRPVVTVVNSPSVPIAPVPPAPVNTGIFDG